ncbi:DUF5060 domain-containing protein [Hymenobacter coalescens]
MRYCLFLLLLGGLLLVAASGPAWALRVREVRVLTATPARYQKLELALALDPARFRNPYDSAEVRVTAEFISPAGQAYWVQGFWYQDFKRCTTCGPPQRLPQDSCYYCNDCPEDPRYLTPQPTPLPWRIRFAPPTAGRWRYRLVVAHADTTISTEPVALTVAASTNPGFVRVHPNGRNFAFESGQVFFPIGMNVTNYWNHGPYNRLPFRDARVGITRIAAQGGNFARVLLIPAQFGIEGPDGPAGRYDARQNRAYDLDEVLELAARRRVYLQMTLITPDELFDSKGFGHRWQTHPYYPLLPPNAPNTSFFTDSVSRQLLRQRIRYIMARWGYSPALFGVELMGEVDNFGGTSDNKYWDRENPRHVRRWTDEMLGYARRLAPQHLYTINVAYAFSANYPRHDTTVALYSSPQVDFVQDHYYGSDQNVEYQRAFMARRAARLFPRKPYQVGEFGMALENDCWYGASSFTAKRYPRGLLYHDLNELHNTLWSSTFNGSGGTALYWWANQVFGLCYGGQEHYFRPLQRFLADCPIFSEKYEPVASPCTAVPGPKDIKHNPATEGNCIPRWAVGNEDAANPDFLPNGASTSHTSLEVFALRSPARVVGWVHHRENYWYRLPHRAGSGTNAAFCETLNDNQPASPDSIPPLVGQQVTILTDVRPGRYRVEFFSTYPFYDVNRDRKNDHGGVIPQFTTEVRAADGRLTFTVPPLRPLGAAPYAPDYGFKATWLPEAPPKPAVRPVRPPARPAARRPAPPVRRRP